MCFYVTAILPDGTDLTKTREIARTHHLNLDPIHNKYIAEQLASKECQYLTTVGQCDCGTLIGSALRFPSTRHTEKSIARREQQLASMGWSKTKIDRWRQQQRQIEDRSARLRKDRLRDWSGEYNAGLEEWIAFLRDVASAGSLKYVGVLLHHYSGRIDEEEFQLRGRRTIQIRQVTPAYLAQIEEDAIYIFRV